MRKVNPIIALVLCWVPFLLILLGAVDLIPPNRVKALQEGAMFAFLGGVSILFLIQCQNNREPPGC
jgi:hypothetical protein